MAQDRQQASSLIETADSKQEGDKQSDQSGHIEESRQPDGNELVQTVISKVFDIQRHYKGKMSDLRHNL